MLPEDLDDLYLNTQLYSSYQYTNDEIDRLYEYVVNARKIDCYCIDCEKDSTFSAEKLNISYNFDTTSRKIQLEKFLTLNRVFSCSRDASHYIIYMFDLTDNVITKIGQNPSIADISNSEIKKYHALLGNERYREFNRAVGLSSHGVGIGSFVYLRRIFEGLIEEAHKLAMTEGDWDEDTYSRMKVSERISRLAGFVPSFLLENKGMYSILSKGIHELSEKECLEMFPVLKLGIELILDEKLEEQQRQEKIKSSSKSITAFLSKLR